VSTETAHRFYRSAGYIDDEYPVTSFGISSTYPMTKNMTARPSSVDALK